MKIQCVVLYEKPQTHDGISEGQIMHSIVTHELHGT